MSTTKTKWSTTIPPPPPTPKVKHRRRRNAKPTTKPRRQGPNLFHDQENETDEAHLVSKSRQKWMLEAELLRAECKILRTEREFALKKLQENRVKMETSLRSAIQTLVSGKKNIAEGENAKAAALDKEIENLAAKLHDLQKSLSIDETSLSILTTSEENNVSNEQTTELSLGSSSSIGLVHQEPILNDGNKCTGRCKSMVRKILEQVRAETEQWSQMQEMLGQVRVEMEELQVSRDYWENRAQDSDNSVQFLQKDIEAWKAKARDYKHKVNQLQLELSLLQEKFQRRKRVVKRLQKQKQSDNDRRLNATIEERNEQTCKKDLAPLSLAKQIANEKKMILRHIKENNHSKRVESCERSPLQDIGNSSKLVRDRSTLSLSFRGIESCRMRESFRK